MKSSRGLIILAGGILTILALGAAALLAFVAAPLLGFELAGGKVNAMAEPLIDLRNDGDNGPAPAEQPAAPVPQGGLESVSLEELYEEISPGVVSIQIRTNRQGLIGAGQGSGFIISEDGYIVTNHHVVANADIVTVIAHDGTQMRAEVVGMDPDSDLAVVKVEELPENTHPIPLGDSDAVRPGQWVVAIGNPFGLASSMTLGIVSATGRTIPSGATPYSIPQAIQTDAAINPGNSGGPLVNLRGEVIGVNAQIRTDSGIAANAGVGFAIPSNIVSRVVPVLIEEGSFEWAWLGVSGQDVTLSMAEALGLEVQRGAYIVSVVEGGPAARAGLRGGEALTFDSGFQEAVHGDVIIEANGEPIESFDEIVTIVANSSPGDTLDLVVLRDGERLEISVELGSRPASARAVTNP
ncbi:MAG TPA: trypsin-like peptidase domain-containing protein [Aggregatilineales bacterium]|nr:trypsin-like peptidase domain-containing protein [Aggregatilineales bacterium]HPV06739.1 trypsin-like peptidase domain-containing protein [Aggregatilineales bacterium]